jgi:peptidoglycan hydrolase-like protein with peptidoglycan-binding domain
MAASRGHPDPSSLSLQHNIYAQVRTHVPKADKKGLSTTAKAAAIALNSLVLAGLGFTAYQHKDYFLGNGNGGQPSTTRDIDDFDLPSEVAVKGDRLIIEPDPVEVIVLDETLVQPDLTEDEQIEIVLPQEPSAIPVPTANPRRPYVDENGLVAVSLRPMINPRFAQMPTLHLFESEPEKTALGCGMQSGFNDFWVAGLDKTPEFKNFAQDYIERLRLPLEIDSNNSFAHRRTLQLLLGLNECYDVYNKDTYDGALGGGTRAAISRFQEVNGLEVTGEANNKTMQYLLHASAMRVMFNMYVMDYTAKQFDIDTQGVFQLAWHESTYNHKAVSYTGADGIGQMINSTFLSEINRTEHPFVMQYAAVQSGDVESPFSSLDELLTAGQHDIWTGTYAMLTHCQTLMSNFNKAGCHQIYGAYQLGQGGYRSLRNAANRSPNRRAGNVVSGTSTNGYGHMTARNALNHVDAMIDSNADRARAIRDVGHLANIVKARNVILDSTPDIIMVTRSDVAPG